MRTRQRLEQIHLHPHFALVREITRRLAPAETVLAGGCVRDALLDVPPKDLDLATAAPPEKVQAAFARTIDVGIKFGTIVVAEDDAVIEVTTFRREGLYEDGRRPTEVVFTDAAEDARRRDFTVNALFYAPDTEELIDHVGGVRDLGQRILRTVGDPLARFGEDHLRMLRAVRFVAQLGFTLDGAAADAIKILKHHVRTVASERILAEMKRLLTSPHRRAALELSADLGILGEIWPECDLTQPDLNPNDWENAFANYAGTNPRPRLEAWRASRESQRRVLEQLRALEVVKDPRAPVAMRLRALGGEAGSDVRTLAEARGLDLREDLARLGTGLPAPFVTGDDLKAAGVPPGRPFGQILSELYDAQLEGRITDRPRALAALAARRG